MLRSSAAGVNYPIRCQQSIAEEEEEEEEAPVRSLFTTWQPKTCCYSEEKSTQSLVSCSRSSDTQIKLQITVEILVQPVYYSKSNRVHDLKCT